MVSPARQQDKRLGWLISLAVHAMVILIFFLINAWKAPNPPLPEYGIELNIGMEQEGFGEEQPITPPVSPQEQASEEQPEETTTETEQVEQETSPTVEETIPDSKEVDSPVEAKPEVKPVPVEPKPKVEEKPKAAETKPKVEEKKVDTKAMYPGAAGQGRKQGQTGDAGNPQGTVESKALYGTQGGGGGGPTLEISGWRWDREPSVIDNSADGGRIVFEIKLDENGDIISIKTIEKTVSPTVEQVYRKEVEKISFSPTSQDAKPAPLTTGKITFIIRSK